MKGLLNFSLVFFLSSFAFATTWTIDPSHSEARFKIRHMMVSNVSGTFAGMTGDFTLDEKDVTKSMASVTIDASTLNTNNQKRDEHLKNPDFFDVATYPKITFKSKKVTKRGKGTISKMTGDLTLHGVTKEVTFTAEGPTPPVKDMQGNQRRGISFTAKISRHDFGITWNKTLETGGLVIGDTADVTVEIEMTQAKAVPQS